MAKNTKQNNLKSAETNHLAYHLTPAETYISYEKKAAALYVRTVSNNEDSCRVQLERLKQQAEAVGFDGGRFYIDNGFAMWAECQPAFERLIEDIKDGIISDVFVTDVFQLCRDPQGMLNWTDFFSDNGVLLHEICTPDGQYKRKDAALYLHYEGDMEKHLSQCEILLRNAFAYQHVSFRFYVSYFDGDFADFSHLLGDIQDGVVSAVFVCDNAHFDHLELDMPVFQWELSDAGIPIITAATSTDVNYLPGFIEEARTYQRKNAEKRLAELAAS